MIMEKVNLLFAVRTWKVGHFHPLLLSTREQHALHLLIRLNEFTLRKIFFLICKYRSRDNWF